MDDKRRRKFRFFDDEDDRFSLFDDVDEIFRREMERVMNIINKILEESSETPGSPIVYGFRIVIGPDGVPRIQKFGNIKPSREIIRTDVYEPTVDVYEKDDTIQVIVEIPGASKDSIRIKAKEDEIYLEAEGERKYAKRIKLPAKVDPKSAKAKFKNGILTIELKKIKKDEGVDVKVERVFLIFIV